jgi:hypothetical protein
MRIGAAHSPGFALTPTLTLRATIPSFKPYNVRSRRPRIHVLCPSDVAAELSGHGNKAKIERGLQPWAIKLTAVNSDRISNKGVRAIEPNRLSDDSLLRKLSQDRSLPGGPQLHSDQIDTRHWLGRPVFEPAPPIE